MREVAEQFRVSPHFVCEMVALYRRTGGVALRPHGGGKGKLGPDGDALLQRLVEQQPDATLEELQDRLRRQRRVRLSLSGVCRALQRLELRRKKNASRG